MENKKIQLLVADPNPSELSEAIGQLQDSRCQVVLVENGADAQKQLREKGHVWDAIFISPSISRPSGLAVVKFAHQFAPGVPVFIMTSMDSTPESEVDLVEAGVSGLIAKPIVGKNIINALGPLYSYFDEEKALEVSKKFKDKVDEELDVKDLEFVPIQAKYFVSGSKCLFDVYVRLRAQKFVKILQAGDPFDPERLLSYLDKGVTHFYIRREAQEAYINYCDKVSEAILKTPEIPMDKKFGILFNQCQSTLNTIVDLGVNNETIAYAQRFTRNTIVLLNKLNKESPGIASLLKDISQFEHSSAVVMMASMLAKGSGIETEKTLETLGLACMLHDVGLYIDQLDSDELMTKVQKKFMEEDEIEERIKDSKCFAEEKKALTKLLKNHPQIGADHLSEIPGISPLVCQIILQHHAYDEKEAGTWAGGHVHPMAELLAVSDRIVKLLKRFKKTGANIDYLKNGLQKCLAPFPMRLHEVFSKTFNL
ncbi:MAG: hypothetical protein OHK0056_10450 [Bacteriovoracaceae bacterium]